MQTHNDELALLFPGDGEMARRMRDFDWSKTDVGPTQDWPQSLKTAIGIMLNSCYPMFVWWGKQRINFYNDNYIPVLGKRHPDALGLRGQQVWHEIWDQLGAQSESVLSESKAVWCDQVMLIMERNGFTEETYFTYSYSPIADDNGNTNGVLCVCSEDTRRVLSQRRLHMLRVLGEATTASTAQSACETVARLLAEHPQDLPFALLYLLDDDGKHARLAGHAGLSAESSAAAADIAIENADASWPLQQVITSAAAVEVGQLQQKFGALACGIWPEMPIQAVILPLAKPGHNALAGFVVAGISPYLVLDEDYRSFLHLLASHVATAVANAEAYAAERKRVAALAEINQAKTTFFSNISHEFRTPLTLLLGPAADLLAERHGTLPEDAQQQVGIIHRNALRMQKLVNNLLDFSRIEAGRMQANYVPTDLAQLSAELASTFRSAVEKAGMRLIVDCPPLQAHVFVDRDMWEKIVLNLLSNAFKYSLQGEICLRLRSQQRNVVLSVSDTGVGIAETELPKLFDRFYRIKGARGRSEEGTGIGLSMVLELARLHGGSVSVDSIAGEGSTFSVTLPLGREHLPAEQVEATEDTSYSMRNAHAFVAEVDQWVTSAENTPAVETMVVPPAPRLANGRHKPTVLIADDNLDMRDYLQRLLSREYRVLTATNGHEALQLAHAYMPDLLLSDVMMPTLDGFELLAALRAEPTLAATAVILLSARAGEEARIEGLAAGADDYLTKPFNARELLARVHGMVALTQARHETHAFERRLRQEAELLNHAHELSLRLLRVADLQHALEEILDAAITMLHAACGSVVLVDDQAQHGRTIALRGFEPEFLAQLNKVGPEVRRPCSEAIRLRRRILVHDIQADAEYAEFRNRVVHARFCGVQSTPLINRKGILLGIICTQFSTPHTPAEHELRLLDIYADKAIDVIERLCMEQALRDSENLVRQELQASSRLHELSTRLIMAPDMHSALEEVLSASVSMLGTRMGSVQLYDAKHDRLKLLAHQGYTQAFLEFFRDLDINLGTPCGHAVRSGQRVMTENIWADPLYAHLGGATDAGFYGVQSTPLIGRDGSVLGVISTHYSEPRLPDAHQLRMLDLYAHQAVSLIERIRIEEALRASEAKFRALAEASPALIWQLDPQGNLTYVNERCKSVLGMAPETLLGSNWHHILQTAGAPHTLADLAHGQREQLPIHRRIEMPNSDDNELVLEAHALPWFDRQGRFSGHVGISLDITENVRAQHDLNIINERLKLAIDGAGDGIWDWDIGNDALVCSPRVNEILEFAAHLPMTSGAQWRALMHPDDIPKVLTALELCLDNSKNSYACEYRMRTGNGGWKWVLDRGIVVARDAAGQPLRMTGTVGDISEKKRHEEAIWQHANFDSLTGLPNRRLFRDRLNQEIRKSQRTQLPVALLFIDLDQFKEVNDLLGHDIGDLLLVDAAKRISACVRQSDTVARLGGDEFTAILTEVEDGAHVEQLARKINATLAQPFQLNDEIIYLSASLGITLYPTDTDNAEKLIRNADQAMYAAKNAGRNRFSFFTPSMQEQAHSRLRLIGDLRSALAGDQLQVYYQPIVDLLTGHIVKAEALLRWRHPQLGMIEPPQFIPLAEESGLIHEIGNWIFEQAALSSQRWSMQLDLPFQISVNKSPVQFLPQASNINWVAHLQARGMQGNSISIEITEGLLLNASSSVIDKLLQYRDAGIQIAIDDFGTGYSSMAYLKKFDIDYLKIDQSFVADMTFDAGSLTIVRSMIVMAHELGLKVIAEGIETEAQKQLLVEAGCDFGQGFLFSEALPADAFEFLLQHNNIGYRQEYLFGAGHSRVLS